MTISIPQLAFTSGEWSPSLYGRVDLAKYASALKLCENFIVRAHGGISNRSGTEFIAEVKNSATRARLVPFQFNVEQSYVLEFGDEYMRVITDGGQVVWDADDVDAWLTATGYVVADFVKDGWDNIYRCIQNHTSGASSEPGVGANWEDYWVLDSVYEIAMPYAAEDLALLKWTQSADVLYLTHPSYAPRKLSRTGHTAWTLTTISFQPTLSAPTGLGKSGSLTGTRSSYVVTAVTEDGEESVPSASYDVGSGETLTWGAVTGASYYYVYKQVNGANGYVARTVNNSWVYEAITPDWDSSTPVAKNPFDSENNYPGTCTFFEQRLLFARTNNDPQTVWGSVIGNFENMNISSPLRDDDSYQFTINALQVNEIKWLVPINELIIGTAGTEWKMAPGSSSDTITPTSVNVKMQSKWGSSDVMPLMIGNTVLYVQNSGNIVRDLLYSLEVDGYTGNNLTLLAEHLFKDHSITEWAFQQAPYSVVWAIRDDGVLLGMTYAREHEVWGWHRHTTDGYFESIASVQTGTTFDDVYFIVQREIDGETVRYIERFVERLPGADVEQAFFVDCGLSLDAPVTITGATAANPVVVTASAHGFSNGDLVDIRAVGGMTELVEDSEGNDLPYKRYTIANVDTNTFELQDQRGNDIDGSEFSAFTSGGTVRKAITSLSGLDHLEGETVVVLANGNVVRDLVVTNGAITLSFAASIIRVGLPFVSKMETLEINISSEGGTLQDRRRDVSSIVARLEDSRAFFAGPSDARLVEVNFRESENYGSPISLFTGDKEVPVYSGDARSARVVIKNVDPVPLTVLTVIPRIVNGDF